VEESVNRHSYSELFYCVNIYIENELIESLDLMNAPAAMSPGEIIDLPKKEMRLKIEAIEHQFDKNRVIKHILNITCTKI
jgi:hypothetical protein